eukprot:14796448-Ditylum_brightwellii.AAC.1
MRDRPKKYKKAYRELTMHQKQKIINEMTLEVMCCLVKEDVGKWVKMSMTICQDTEAREDDTEGLGSELDDNTKKSGLGILSEATG